MREEPNAHEIFLKVRDGSVKTLGDFLRPYHLDPSTLGYGSSVIEAVSRSNVTLRGINILSKLIDSDFISVCGNDGRRFEDSKAVFDLDTEQFFRCRVSATKLWRNLVNVYGIGVEALAKVRGENVYIVEPIFKAAKVPPVDVFVALPYSSGFDQVFGAIAQAGMQANKVIRRGDDVDVSAGANVVMNEVWGFIREAKMVVVDVSGKNPNVFYELGMAHALGKPTTIITRDQEDVPFDIRHIRYVSYTPDPKGLEKLGNQLTAILSAL